MNALHSMQHHLHKAKSWLTFITGSGFYNCGKSCIYCKQKKKKPFKMVQFYGPSFMQ